VRERLYRKVLKALQESFFAGYASPERAKEVARKALRHLLPEGDLDNTVEELLAEARERSKEALYSFFKDLGLPPLPAIEEAFRDGEEVGIWPWWERGEVVVTLGRPHPRRESAPLPPKWERKKWPNVSLYTLFGGIEARVEVVETESIWISEKKERLVFRLDASRGRAFFAAQDPRPWGRLLKLSGLLATFSTP